MTVLVLGGTAEAVALAKTLYGRGVALVYSVAGLVRQPELPCPVISGGFSRHGGLVAYLNARGITLVLDATHPYAAQMSANAAHASRAVGIACWRYLRRPWAAGSGDDWRDFEDWAQLVDALRDHRAVFFTVGQVPRSFVDSLVQQTRGSSQRQWLRSALRPDFELAPSMTWIQAIGPFELEQERALMNSYGIDALVSKNSGGAHTAAKLAVARERRIPVYMLRRPTLSPVDCEFHDLEACCARVIEVAGSRRNANVG